MWQLAAVGVGGCVGAIARYMINGWADRQFPGFLPAGTLLANVLGCLLIGIVMVLVHDRKWFSPETQSLLVTGFLGSLTTFSTFAYQTVELFEEQRIRAGLFNLFANLAIGFTAVAVALWITRRVLGN
jgi:CrcB protein